MVVTAELNDATRETATTVRVSLAAGTAATDDFTAVDPFDVVIAAGETRATATFTLVPAADAFAEGDETVSVSGDMVVPERSAAAALPVTGATITIADDDRRGIELAPASLTVREGERGRYTVRLSSAPTAPVRVRISRGARGSLDVAREATQADVTTDVASVEFTGEDVEPGADRHRDRAPG